MSSDNIEAAPRDVNVLPESDGNDPRTLDKLYDGVYNTFADNHMWLAPMVNKKHAQHSGNTIFIFFDSPVSLSRVTFWNYSKTPSRGVREFEIFVDDVLVFHGVMKRAPRSQDLAKEAMLKNAENTNLNDR